MLSGQPTPADSGFPEPTRRSAVESEPAQLVAKPLVVEHEFTDLVGKLCALPPAFDATSRYILAFGSGRAGCPDRVRRSAELVGCHVAHRRGLTGSVRRMSRRPTQVSGRGVRMAGGGAGHSPRDLTPGPSASQVDRPSRTVVPPPRLLEVVQHMLRAVGRPHREQVVIVVIEAAAAPHGDEPWVPDLGEDHAPYRRSSHTGQARPGGRAVLCARNGPTVRVPAWISRARSSPRTAP